MHVVVARVSAAYTILATVGAAIVATAAMPAHAQGSDMSCPAINAELARLSNADATTETEEADAAKKRARKHMVLGFAKTMATSMLPFGGMIAGGGGAGGMISALGQAAAQAGMESGARAATAPMVTRVDSEQRLAQLSAMSAARGCMPA